MSDYLYISYPVACSLVAVTVTSIALNIWGLLRSFHAPITFAAHSGEALKPRRVPQKQYQLQPGTWSDEATFSLERRSILSQSWICVSHRGRFTKPGDYITLDLAGFRIFLIMGKDSIVRTFHNVCRHRAFPITRKAAGSATLLGCRYHGWSYNTKGELTKAPQFDQLPGFDKSANSLFEIHTKTDSQGLIYINLNSDPKATESAPSEPSAVGRQVKIGQASTFLRSWDFQGHFNWKSSILDRLQDESVDSLASHNLHFKSQSHHFPLSAVYSDAKSSVWFHIIFSPRSAEETSIRCDAYASERTDMAYFERVLAEKLERYLNARVDRHERQHQLLEETCRVPGEFQAQFAEIATLRERHRAKEDAEKTEIDPAAVRQCKSSAFNQAEGICKAMEGASGKLDW